MKFLLIVCLIRTLFMWRLITFIIIQQLQLSAGTPDQVFPSTLPKSPSRTLPSQNQKYIRSALGFQHDASLVPSLMTAREASIFIALWYCTHKHTHTHNRAGNMLNSPRSLLGLRAAKRAHALLLYRLAASFAPHRGWCDCVLCICGRYMRRDAHCSYRCLLQGICRGARTRERLKFNHFIVLPYRFFLRRRAPCGEVLRAAVYTYSCGSAPIP